MPLICLWYFGQRAGYPEMLCCAATGTGDVISVIIGTENCARALIPTLSTLVSGAAAGAVREVIIADAGSTDATAEVADSAGCELIVSKAPLAVRLKEAAARARASWLMFLKPGVTLDANWIDETTRFIEHAELAGRLDQCAAVFRRAPSVINTRPLLFEALTMLKSTFGGRPHPDQGLLIFKRLYDQLGGHRSDSSDPETDLLARIGRKRTVMLRSGAVKVVGD
jgi:glycosyltransferase involved in cell wall biosynthesis